MLIGMGIGVYFVFTGNTDALKKPFIQSLKEYDPSARDGPSKALVKMWDDFQQDVGRKKLAENCMLIYIFFSTNVVGWNLGKIGANTTHITTQLTQPADEGHPWPDRIGLASRVCQNHAAIQHCNRWGCLGVAQIRRVRNHATFTLVSEPLRSHYDDFQRPLWRRMLRQGCQWNRWAFGHNRDRHHCRVCRPFD